MSLLHFTFPSFFREASNNATKIKIGSPFKLNASSSEKFFNILDSKNFSFFKLLGLSKEFFISRYKQFNNDFYMTCSYIISRIIYLFDDVPAVISPLVYGLEKDNKKVIKYRLNNYINNVFKNNDLKKLVIVTHPHRNHLVNDKTKYKENISLIINNTIFNSPHKKKNITYQL